MRSTAAMWSPLVIVAIHGIQVWLVVAIQDAAISSALPLGSARLQVPVFSGSVPK
ncbi:hypothetical protein ACIQTW_06740 [Paenarthrobacter sp. NPDC090517]|uniref:hypothetical protein n=1 Tax=Paenarthrobacter sp. NPDC090517 TaxID=3364381 RepID=UPI003804BD69